MIRDFSLILFYDEKKRVLLQHRTEDAPRLPGYWGLFGGGMEGGETPEEAVRRETFEELEYKLAAPKLIMAQKYNDAEMRGIKYVFMEKYNPDKKLVLNEGQGKEWYAPDKTSHLKMTDDDREILEFVKGKY